MVRVVSKVVILRIKILLTLFKGLVLSPMNFQVTSKDTAPPPKQQLPCYNLSFEHLRTHNRVPGGSGDLVIK